MDRRKRTGVALAAGLLFLFVTEILLLFLAGNSLYKEEQPEYAGQQMMNQFYQQAQAAGSTIYHGSGQMPGYGSAPAASTPPKTGQMLQGALQNLDTSLPVEELMKHMNYEMAVGTVIPGKGKYGGKTMGQVAVESPSTIQWFAEQYSGPNNLVPAAAKVILQKAMPMAG